jgi:hypothetical protein
MSAIAHRRPRALPSRRLDARLRSRSLAAYLDAGLHLAALSLVAGAIHAVVAVPHYSEYWLFGSLFVAVALFQLGWGIQAYRRPSAALYRAGIAVNLAVAAAWLVSRTVGLPIGPEPGSAEAVGALDVVCTAIELGVAGLCLAFLRPDRRLLAPVGVVRSLALGLMGAGLLLLLLGVGHGH